MKKTLSLVLTLAMMLLLLAGCGGKPQESADSDPNATSGESTGLADLDPITILFAIPNGTNNIETIYAE